MYMYLQSAYIISPCYGCTIEGKSSICRNLPCESLTRLLNTSQLNFKKSLQWCPVLLTVYIFLIFNVKRSHLYRHRSRRYTVQVVVMATDFGADLLTLTVSGKKFSPNFSRLMKLFWHLCCSLLSNDSIFLYLTGCAEQIIDQAVSGSVTTNKRDMYDRNFATRICDPQTLHSQLCHVSWDCSLNFRFLSRYLSWIFFYNFDMRQVVILQFKSACYRHSHSVYVFIHFFPLSIRSQTKWPHDPTT